MAAPWNPRALFFFKIGTLILLQIGQVVKDLRVKLSSHQVQMSIITGFRNEEHDQNTRIDKNI